MSTFLLAWHFLTAVPLTRRHQVTTMEQFASSMVWFPTVGLVIGLTLAASATALDLILPRNVVDWMLILLLVLLTRGLHLDGLADTLDGWAGGRTSNERLEIMRDPRIGAFGAIGLVLALGLRQAGLFGLPDSGRWAMIATMPLLGRWAMVVGGVAAPYARADGGLAHPFLAHLAGRHVLMATAVPAVWLLWWFGPIGTLSILVLLAALVRVVTALSLRWCGGVTGDVFGLMNELAEVVFLVAGPLCLEMR